MSVKVTIERIPESQVRLDIAADPDEQNQAIEKAYRKVAREVVIPGFRKGKAPRSMVERYFGREIAQRTATYMEYQSRAWMT